MPIVLFLQVREESPFATESLYGLGLAAGLLLSCSFPIQTVTQQRWLVQSGVCALHHLEIFLPSLCMVLYVTMKAGRWSQPVSSRSPSRIWSFGLVFFRKFLWSLPAI